MADDRILKVTAHRNPSPTGWGDKWVGVARVVDENGFEHNHKGYGDTKSEAKRNAINAVFSILENSGIGFDRDSVIVDITSPNIDAKVEAGRLVEFTMDDPVGNEGDRKTFTTEYIPQNAAFWLFGMECCFDSTLSEKYELVSTMLKVWGVFRGGDSQDSVMALHNMSFEIFEAIAKREWTEITMTINAEGIITNWELIND